MKRLKIAMTVTAASAILLGTTACGMSQGPGSVETTGVSTATLVNDSTTITYSVIFDANSPQTANRESQKILNKINVELRSQFDLKDDQFKTVSAATSDVEDSDLRRAEITTAVRDISTDKTLRVIDAILSKGEMNARLDSVSAEPSDTRVKAGADRAYQDAKRKAESLAAAADRRLGRVLEIVSSDTTASPRALQAEAADFNPGTQDVTSTITVKWSLKR